jgi:hypothetical protein
MKKLLEIKKLREIITDYTSKLDLQIQLQLKKIKLEYNNNIHEEKIKLLIAICQDENLDFEKLKQKYIKTNINTQYTILPVLNIPIDEDILDKIEIDNVIYYYENKENGKVYDDNLNIIGKYINGFIQYN